MRPNKRKVLKTLLFTYLIWTLCIGTISAGELTEREYKQSKTDKGVVLLSVNWNRAWRYCGFENVQLRSLGFDRMPVRKEGDLPLADLVLEGPALLTKPFSEDYALLVDPGEYALAAFLIKAAKSVNDVGGFNVGRTQLIEEGKPLAGSFSVGADEIVYIGHFAPDCPQLGQPVIWRYYLKDAAAFRDYLTKVKTTYPYLDIDKAKFRLFKTNTIGQDYQLQ